MASGADVASATSATSIATSMSIAVSASRRSSTTLSVDPYALVDPGADANTLAVSLSAAEIAIRDARLSADLVGRAGRAQQLAYRRLASHPEWEAAVLARVDASVRVAVLTNIGARNSLRTIKGGPAKDTLPAFTVLAPAPPDKLLSWYHEASDLTGISWEYLAAINLVETRMGRIRATSTAGAQGPMQFLPETWSRCCHGDINDSHDAIVGAATYLQQRGGPTDMNKAIFGYNPSQGYVEAIQAYASVIAANKRAFYGYYEWQVFVDTTVAGVRLPVGFSQPTRISAADYLAAHPEDRAPSG